jgi:hypothetical protein
MNSETVQYGWMILAQSISIGAAAYIGVVLGSGAPFAIGAVILLIIVNFYLGWSAHRQSLQE